MSTPTLFSATTIGPGLACQRFVGGGLHFNNPTREVLNEATGMFGDQNELGLLLSLGSGRPGVISVDSFVPIPETMDSLLIRLSRNCEVIARGLSNELEDTPRYIRLTVDQGMEDLELTNWESLGRVAAHTSVYLQGSGPNKSMNLSAEIITGRFGHGSELSLHLRRSAATLKEVLVNTGIVLSELKPKDIERESPHAECMEGTRLDILAEVDHWVADMDAPNILWIHGHPGVGKSAIAASIMARLQESRRLGSSFVFQREKSTIMTTRNLLRTVAFDLAHRYSTFKEALVCKLNSDHIVIGTTSVKKLFRHLIRDPLTRSEDIPMGRYPVVVVDALDECGGLEGPYSKDREDLIQVLEMWSKFPRIYKLVVTSRNEIDIAQTFDTIPHKLLAISMGQAVSTQSMNDIQAFLERQFQKIRASNSGLSSQWPGSDIIKELVNKTRGLFIWAQTIVRIVRRGEPKGQLNRVLHGRIGNISSLYSFILNISFPDPSKEEIMAFQLVMGAVLLARMPLSQSTMGSLLSIESSRINHICNGLYSVLEPGEILRIGHQSFADFLIDEKECPNAFHIRLDLASQHMTLSCLQTMKSELCFNICQLKSSYFRNCDVPDIASSIKRYISPQLSYSAWYWAEHLRGSQFDSTIQRELQVFMDTKFLFWLEVLSLTKRVNAASDIMGLMVEWLEKYGENATVAKDMQRFVIGLGSVISQSVPHIYLSALPLAPENSAVKKKYEGSYKRTIRISRGGQDHWPTTQHILKGHTQSVNSVAFSPDSKYIVSGSGDNTVRVWDAETGNIVTAPFTGHKQPVTSVSFSIDSQWVISGSSDKTIRVWNAETGDLIAGPFEGHKDTVRSVSFSPDGKRVVSGSTDATILVWNSEMGNIISGPFEGHKGTVLSVAFSPDGQWVVSGSSDKTIRVCEADSGKLIAGPFEGHTLEVQSVAFSPDGKRIVSGSADATIRVWDIESGNLIAGPFEGHEGWVSPVAFSPHGRWIVSGSTDKTIRVWDAESRDLVAGPFEGHSDGKRVVSGSADMTIMVWDVEMGNAVEGPFEGHGNSVDFVSFSRDGKRIFSGSPDGTLRGWDVETGDIDVGPFETYEGEANSGAFSLDNKCIFSGSLDRAIHVWDVEMDGTIAESFEGYNGISFPVAFSPDGKCVVSGYEDDSIRVWNTETGGLIARPFKGHKDIVNCVAFSLDGKRVVSGSANKTIWVWDTDRAVAIAGPFEGHENGILSVAFSPDGKRVASGSWDKSVRVWEAETGKMIARPLEGHKDGVSSVSFSPNGQWVVSGSYDSTVRMWDIETDGIPIGLFEEHESDVNCVAFSPDGRYIVSGSSDQTICDHGVHSMLHSAMDNATLEDGWVLGPNSELIFWVPPALRQGFMRPSNRLIIGKFVKTVVDLSSFVCGESWTDCAK
ncbi:WD40 repeat-like protein [Serendipita vermifera]|nr:WD40 repeat-like protein [Serendipita vermifera]